MDPEFVALLKKLVAEQGRETLLNGAKCKAFLSDYTRNEFKKESHLLLQALDAGAQKAIDTAENIAICKKQQIRALSEDYSLAEEKAADVVDTLALVLRGDKSRTEIQVVQAPGPVPKKAGKNKGSIIERVLTAVQSNQSVPKNDVAPKIGDIIPFGKYKWRVLDARVGEALIITDNVIEERPYNVAFTDVTWETCDLRKYLNGVLYNTFSEGDKKRIVETTNHNPDNLWYGTKGGRDTHDKIFLLSLEEADRYFGDSRDYVNKRGGKGRLGFFSSSYDGNRIANYEDEACWWWLRSHGDNSISAACVLRDGSVCVYGHTVHSLHGGVHPALWLKV